MNGQAIKALMARPIAFHRAFVDLGVGITGAVMLSQAFYWSQKTGDGWFFKSQDEWTNETGLTRFEQEGARRALRTIEVLHEERRGHPARLFYRVDFDRLAQLLTAGLDGKKVPKTPTPRLRKTSKQDCGKAAIKNAENQQSSVRKSSNLDCGKPANRSAENQQSTNKETKTTSKTTEKTTSETTYSAPLAHRGTDDGFALVAVDAKTAAQPEPDKTAQQTACRATWQAYHDAYMRRYGTEPVRNARTNAQVVQLVKRLGASEAPHVSAFFVDNINDAFVVRNCHGFGLLLAQAEGYRTQWASGRTVTATQAQQADRMAANANTAQGALALLQAKWAKEDAQAGVDAEDYPC